MALCFDRVLSWFSRTTTTTPSDMSLRRRIRTLLYCYAIVLYCELAHASSSLSSSASSSSSSSLSSLQDVIGRLPEPKQASGTTTAQPPPPPSLPPPRGRRGNSRGHPLPPPLIETARQYFERLPTPKRINEERLTGKLGKDFNPEWMSVKRPSSGPSSSISSKRPLDAYLVAELSALNFSVLETDGEHVPLKPHVQKLLEKWLLQRGSCPVGYDWQDVGSLFWPRWVRRGMCVNREPCSWPPGMQCVPAESRTIHLLRWHCRPRRVSSLKRNRKRGQGGGARNGLSSLNRRKLLAKRGRKHRRKIKIKCRWIKVPYPVTSECFCSC